MDTQCTFNKVLAAGHYHNYMCYALKDSYEQGVITKAEKEFAIIAIRQYLGEYQTLYSALVRYGFPHTPMHCRAVYENWANRPHLNKEATNEKHH